MTDGTSTAVWLAENGIGAPVDYYAYGGLLARRKAEQAEREAERAEARRQAQLEEARDQRATAQYLAGVQPGAAIALALAIQDVETEIATRQAEIDKLARRRDRLVQEGRDQDEAVFSGRRRWRASCRRRPGSRRGWRGGGALSAVGPPSAVMVVTCPARTVSRWAPRRRSRS